VTFSDKTGEPALMISCAYGERPSAIVCGHMLSANDKFVGFVENSADANDLQAWSVFTRT